VSWRGSFFFGYDMIPSSAVEDVDNFDLFWAIQTFRFLFFRVEENDPKEGAGTV
jgi:hypothetical protein